MSFSFDEPTPAWTGSFDSPEYKKLWHEQFNAWFARKEAARKAWYDQKLAAGKRPATQANTADRSVVRAWKDYWLAHPCDILASEAVEQLSRLHDLSPVLGHLLRDAPACIERKISVVVRVNNEVQFFRRDDSNRVLALCSAVRAAITVVPISLIYEEAATGDAERISHAILLLVDHVRKEAEFFNPWGAGGENDAAIEQLLENSILVEHPEYTFQKQELFCPYLGPQRKSGGGTCVSWSLLYAFSRVQEPQIDRDIIIDELLEGETQESLRRLIDAFACWVWGHSAVRSEQRAQLAFRMAKLTRNIARDRHDLADKIWESLRPELTSVRKETYEAYWNDPLWRSQREEVLQRGTEIAAALRRGDDQLDQEQYSAAISSYDFALEASSRIFDALHKSADRILAGLRDTTNDWRGLPW